MSTATAPSLPEPGTLNPADLSPLSPVAQSSAEDVQAAVAAARTAQLAWGATSLDERCKLVLAFGRRIVEKRAEIGLVLSQETGRQVTECLMSEVVTAISFAKAAIRAGRNALTVEKIKLSPLEFPGKKVIVEPVPRGVIGIIAPWNYPLGNFMKSLIPALLAGNGVVLKPSEHTPRSGALLASLCGEIFPKGLVQLVQGGGAVGAGLIDAGIDAVVFTGSVPTGKRVAQKAAERLIPCSVELGGKDAAIVLADCHLERTVVGVTNWAIHNAGQNCAAIERVYVEDAIADKFVERLAKVVGQLRVAPQPEEGMADLGPMQNEAQLRIVEAHVEEAKLKGAKLLCGGARTGRGLGYQPTVLDRCDHTMRVVNEETFGPVIAVVRVRDAEEAIRLANDTRYGLNGSVWTANLERGAELARRLVVGVALVNNHSVTGVMPETPWTGTRDTGFGVASSRHAYPTFVRRRTVFIDSAKQPEPFWFPFNADMTVFAEKVAQMSLGSLGATLSLLGLIKKRVAAITKLASGS